MTFWIKHELGSVVTWKRLLVKEFRENSYLYSGVKKCDHFEIMESNCLSLIEKTDLKKWITSLAKAHFFAIPSFSGVYRINLVCGYCQRLDHQPCKRKVNMEIAFFTHFLINLPPAIWNTYFRSFSSGRGIIKLAIKFRINFWVWNVIEDNVWLWQWDIGSSVWVWPCINFGSGI